MEIPFITIREVLLYAQDLKWSDSLFLSDSECWTLETKGIIWDPDDLEDEEDEVPRAAKEQGLLCGIAISEIQSVVSNAHQQLPACSPEQLLEAFLYYYDHDAFLTLHKD